MFIVAPIVIVVFFLSGVFGFSFIMKYLMSFLVLLLLQSSEEVITGCYTLIV